jgi:hypothetical protein
MRLVIRPISEPAQMVDVTDCVVRVIAEELQRAVGGNQILNMLEAERAVQSLLSSGTARAGRVEAP